MKKIKLHTPLDDLSSEQYHSTPKSYSSSQIKDLLGDEEYFYKKYIAKTLERETSGAFDIGSYFHCAVLEPEKLEKECAVFEGAVKRGNEYEHFCLKHAGKTIVSRRDKEKAEQLVAAVRASPRSMELLEDGKPEISMFVKLIVSPTDGVYAPNIDSWITPSGWEKNAERTAMGSADAISMIVKVRADFISERHRYLVDLKSTTGNAKDEYTVKQKVSSYNYDLSAALYLDMFSAGTKETYDNFYWTFASKDFMNARSWRASEKNIAVGRAKWTKCVMRLAGLIANNWKFEDTIGTLNPNFYELEHLNETL